MADETKQLKMAVIAGASHALKFKDKNWRATEEEVLQYISEHIDEIVAHMDNPIA